MILRHASGIADVDAYIDGANSGVYRLDLELMSEFVSVMSADVSHVCRRWRRTIAPAFYHYVMYDDYEDCLVAPEGCEQHVRWLLVHMPDDVSSFRSIVQDFGRDGSSNSNSSNSHSSLERILEMVVAMSELKVLTPIAGFLYNRPLLEPSCPSLPHLRALDISSWLLTLCDLQLLLSKLL
ncbi:hypothetical protein IWQ56_003005, partial [Coemansia nantahalensis]